MEKLIQKLKEVLGVTDVASLSNDTPVVRIVASSLGVGIPTIERWINGEAKPHKAMIPVINEVLDDSIELQKLVKQAPWNEPSICRKIFTVTEVTDT